MAYLEPTLDDLRTALDKLYAALENNRSIDYCRGLWSELIRLRDGNRCVRCHGEDRLAAHHIVRKSYLPMAQFLTGNGITLCKLCHNVPHRAFNRKPNMQLPMDAEGGDDNDLITEYFSRLFDDADERGLLCDEFYYISDDAL
jgi:hypothetical protein